ncbi:MAG TPA: GTP-binding protein [Alphaproteobacteria bacterium]
MRLKSFSAPTMAQAMALVRRELGESAVIVSTTSAVPDGVVRVTAAVEHEVADDMPMPADVTAAGPGRGVDDAVRALNDHGVPIGIIDRMFDRLVERGRHDALIGLTVALESQFTFAPLVLSAPREARPRPILLVGPPGAGKSVTAAKLATGAALQRRPVALIGADAARAGAIEQLAALAAILDTPIKRATDPRTLREVVAAAAPGTLLLIDTAGTNPFVPQEMAALADLATAAGAEIVLVLAAGGDVGEMAETAAAFAAIGATRLVATRLDAARRFGGVLAAAAAPLALAAAGVAPAIANGLAPLDAPTLARLLLGREIALGQTRHVQAAQ